MTPVYDYECLNCGLKGEYFVHLRTDIILCSKCKHEMTKQISVPSVIKGDDYNRRMKHVTDPHHDPFEKSRNS